MAIILCDHSEYADMAALLLAMAAEAGHHVRVVQTVTGGFIVPDDLHEQLFGPAPERTPPTWWSEPLTESGVEVIDGKVMLTEAEQARLVEEIAEETALGDLIDESPGFQAVPLDADVREWAKEAGIPVSDKGRLSKSVLEAYAAR